MDINPWLAEVIMEYRQKHSDDYLRKRYISYLADRSETSWSSFLANVSLEYKMHREPFLKTPRREFGFSAHLQDLMNVMEINIATGRGYVPAEQNKDENTPIAVIPVDSIYTPVPGQAPNPL